MGKMNIKAKKMVIFMVSMMVFGLAMLSMSSSLAYAHGAPHQGFLYGEQHLCSYPQVGHQAEVHNSGGFMDATLTTTYVNYYWFNMYLSYQITWEDGSTGSGGVQCY